MSDQLTQILSNKLYEAKDAVSSEKDADHVETIVREFIGCVSELSNIVGEEGVVDVLREQRLNDYEIEQIVNFKNQTHISDAVIQFFSKINLETIKDVSPLSSNEDWLSKNSLNHEALSKEYSQLISYITQDLIPKDKAEFLAILDRYVSVTANTANGAEILSKLKNFDSNNVECSAFLIKEINNFAKRYHIDSDLNVKEVKGKAGYILYRDGAQIRFNAGSSSQTDCVFTENDGSLGLICVTSGKNTSNQHQVYKYRKALIECFNVNVIPYIYCDSLLTFNQEKNKKGASKISANENISKLSDSLINSFNLIGSMLVFARHSTSDESDLSFMVDTIKESQLQLFNDNAGLKIKPLDAKGKVNLLEESLNNVVNEINKNSQFWLDNSNEFNVQKRILLDVCSAYNWLDDMNAINLDTTKQNMVNLFNSVNLSVTVNLNQGQDALIASTKKNLGISKKNKLF